jgi:aerobic carbon-monoxide dehydrogenase medium subunit
MIPAAFEYARPKTIDEALALLAKREDAKVLAGGHSLIPMMKLRLSEPGMLVDIGALGAMSEISYAEGRFTIGALVTHAELAASAELERHAPALWEAANQLGDPQVRNRGTVGGACAHADPSADYPAVMLALDATFTLVGEAGSRDVSAGDFFAGMFETVLGPAEIVRAVSFDAAPHSAYAKLHHPASHYAIVGVAVRLAIDGGTIRGARVAITGVGDVAFRSGGVEQALVGLRASDTAAVGSASAGAAAGVDARSDGAASRDYRVAMVDIFTARALERAASR